MLKLKEATDTLKEVAAIYVVLLMASAAAYMWLEEQSFQDSLYWAATTATSTGYGDLSPKTPGGRILAVALMHASIFFIAPMIIVRLIDQLNVDRDSFTHEEQVHILEGIARIEARLERLEQSDSVQQAPPTG